MKIISDKKMKQTIYILFVLFAFFKPTASVRQQSIRVTGTLKCGDRPASNVHVKLWDEDDGNFFVLNH